MLIAIIMANLIVVFLHLAMVGLLSLHTSSRTTASQHQEYNHRCFSCNTTLTIAPCWHFLQYELVAMMIATNSIWKFDCCMVGHHCHTLTTFPCPWSLPRNRTYPYSTAIQCKNCSPRCSLIAIRHKKHAHLCRRFLQLTVCILQWRLVACVLAIP